jgi:hypothetical protein
MKSIRLDIAVILILATVAMTAGITYVLQSAFSNLPSNVLAQYRYNLASTSNPHYYNVMQRLDFAYQNVIVDKVYVGEWKIHLESQAPTISVVEGTAYSVVALGRTTDNTSYGVVLAQIVLQEYKHDTDDITHLLLFITALTLPETLLLKYNNETIGWEIRGYFTILNINSTTYQIELP